MTIGRSTIAPALQLVARLAADVVMLDCAALDLNALAVLPWLKAPPVKSHVIALGAFGTSTERRLLTDRARCGLNPTIGSRVLLGQITA
jgi:hypothetical protein